MMATVRHGWTFNYLRFLARRAHPGIHPGGSLATTALLARLNARPGSAVLEIGCGTGATAVRLAVRGVRVTTVDVLSEMVIATQKRSRFTNTRVSIFRANALEGLPFASASFDAAYTESVLGMYDAADAVGVLREVHRVLRRNGRFVANEAVWRDDAAQRAPTAAAELVARFGLPPASLDGSTLDQWKARMAFGGFEVETEALTPALGRRDYEVLRGDIRVKATSAAFSAVGLLASYLVPSLASERRRFRQALRAPSPSPEPLTHDWLFTLTKTGA